MGTHFSLPSPSYIPQGQVLAPEQVSIREYHAELQSAARNLRQSLAKIAFYGWKMRLNQGWTAIGFAPGSKGEEAYADSLDIPRSSYFKHVRIGQCLHQLTLDELTKIPTTNAELLIQVNPALWLDHNWVREAQTMKSTKLAELVAARNKTVGDEREPLTNMVVRVPFLAKEAMETMLESVQTKYQLSSKGQALEFMIADLHNDANLIAAVNQARQLIEGTIKSMRRRKALEGEEEGWLLLAKGLLDESYEKAVQTARQKSNGGQKAGGRS